MDRKETEEAMKDPQQSLFVEPFSMSSPHTLRLPDDLHDRLEQSRIAAGESSPAAAIRRLLRQALDQDLIDDRLARLIQERVTIPGDLAKQYVRATDAATQAVNANQAEMKRKSSGTKSITLADQ